MGKALPAGSHVRSAIVVRVPLATSVVFGAGTITRSTFGVMQREAAPDIRRLALTVI
jgi:hypothetical protein